MLCNYPFVSGTHFMIINCLQLDVIGPTDKLVRSMTVSTLCSHGFGNFVAIVAEHYRPSVSSWVQRQVYTRRFT